MTSPGWPTPSIRAPIAAIVAAWVSCWWSRVTAQEWAAHHALPTLLIRPQAATGLERTHVEEVRAFIEAHRVEVPPWELRR